MRSLASLSAIALCLLLLFSYSIQAAPETPVMVKELNYVILHGAGGHTGNLQSVADFIEEQGRRYIVDYEKANPGIKVQVNVLQRYYPNDVDIETWAKNIADSINKYFPDKKNLILVGHSMGGKAALYAVAHNTQQISAKVALVVTINSPIRRLKDYYVTSSGSAAVFCGARWLLSDRGVCDSLDSYDSSQDGSWVSKNKHWLAFISAEPAPLSPRFPVGSIDGWPRDMDDGFVPVSAQYSEGADVVYYGESGHGDFSESDSTARFISDKILRYLFGGVIESPSLIGSGVFEHRAGWLPIKYTWNDTFSEVVVSRGRFSHTNTSYLKRQYWEEVVGGCPPRSIRSSYSVRLINPLPFIAGIEEVRWLTPDVPGDCRLIIRSKAAPKIRAQIEWTVFRYNLLPPGGERAQYEVKINTGTPQAGIPRASWVTDNVRDVRLQVWSEAEGPFRWLKAEWKVYSKENHQRKIIDEIQPQPLR